MPGLLLPNTESSSILSRVPSDNIYISMPSVTSGSSSYIPSRPRVAAASRRSGRHDPIGALISSARQKRQEVLDQKLTVIRIIASTQNLLSTRPKKGKMSPAELIDAMWMEGKPSTGAVRAYFDALRELQRFDEVIAPKLWIELGKYPADHSIFSSGSPPQPVASASAPPKICVETPPESPSAIAPQQSVPTPLIHSSLSLPMQQSRLEVPSRPLKRSHRSSPGSSQSSTDVEPDFMSDPPMTTHDLEKVDASLGASVLDESPPTLRTRSPSVDTVVEGDEVPPTKRRRMAIVREASTRNLRSTRKPLCG
jgi:hypothetical protein